MLNALSFRLSTQTTAINFSSNIAHGNADEETALREYEPLRSLVVGIIENVKKKEEEIQKNAEIQKALEQIGFSHGGDDSE